MTKEVKTQAEFNEAIAGGYEIDIRVNGLFDIRSGAPLVRAYEHASPTIVAYGNSSPTIVAYSDSSPTMVAYDNSSPTMVAYGNSSPTMAAYDHASPRMVNKSKTEIKVKVSRYAFTVLIGMFSAAGPHVILENPEITNAEQWCDYHGVKIDRGVAVLFKAVDFDYSTYHARAWKIFYTPGNAPEAPDWDGGKAECGGGLHFSPDPARALKFNKGAKHFIACPVQVSEIVVHEDPKYSDKVKAPRVCAPCWEVNINGNKIEA